MGDEAEKAAKAVEEWFGVPTAWIAVPAAIVAAVTIELHIQSKLGDPLFRWLGFGTFGVLCLLGLLFDRRPRKDSAFGTNVPIRRSPRATVYGCGLAVSMTLLGIDLGFNYETFWIPVEIDEPLVLGGTMIAVSKEDGKAMDSLNLRSVSSVTPLEPQLADGPGIEFSLRKKDNHAEVVLENIIVTVDKFEKLPRYEVDSAWAGTVDRLYVLCDIGKQVGPLPWSIHPSQYFTNSAGIRRWESGCLSLRDVFRQPIRIVLKGHDEGIYCLNVKLVVSYALGRHSELTLFPKPVGFGYLPKSFGTTPPVIWTQSQKPYLEVDDLDKYMQLGRARAQKASAPPP